MEGAVHDNARHSAFVSSFVIDVKERVDSSVETNEPTLLTSYFNERADSVSERFALNRLRKFQENLRPLLLSMKVVGMYFENNDKLTATNLGLDEENEKRSKQSVNENSKGRSRSQFKRYSYSADKIYSTIILVIMWMQFFRMLSAFTNQDTTPLDVISKLIYVNYTLKCALMITSFYRGSYSGTLQKTLHKLPLISDCELPIRKRILIYATISWIVIIVNTVCMTYLVLFPGNRAQDSLLAPINTQFTDCSSSTVLILRILFIAFNFYMNAAWVFAVSASSMITAIFTHIFLDLNAKVRSAIKVDGRFEGDLEGFRQKHQRISQLVDETDKYLSLYKGTAMVASTATFVMVLYSLIFYQNQSFLVMAIMIFWLVSSSSHLVIMAFGCVKLNNAAHKLFDKLPNISLHTLNSETIGQLNVFLKSLNGSSIGFTVLRIFVIDRNTILTIIGMLITYFLLIVQLSTSANTTSSSSLTTVTNNNATLHAY